MNSKIYFPAGTFLEPGGIITSPSFSFILSTWSTVKLTFRFKSQYLGHIYQKFLLSDDPYFIALSYEPLWCLSMYAFSSFVKITGCLLKLAGHAVEYIVPIPSLLENNSGSYVSRRLWNGFGFDKLAFVMSLSITPRRDGVVASSSSSSSEAETASYALVSTAALPISARITSGEEDSSSLGVPAPPLLLLVLLPLLLLLLSEPNDTSTSIPSSSPSFDPLLFDFFDEDWDDDLLLPLSFSSISTSIPSSSSSADGGEDLLLPLSFSSTSTSIPSSSSSSLCAASSSSSFSSSFSSSLCASSSSSESPNKMLANVESFNCISSDLSAFSKSNVISLISGSEDT